MRNTNPVTQSIEQWGDTQAERIGFVSGILSHRHYTPSTLAGGLITTSIADLAKDRLGPRGQTRLSSLADPGFKESFGGRRVTIYVS
jgi:hypothetical protein